MNKVFRKSVDIKEADWARLKQLAANHKVTLREEVDQIIETFLSCVEDNNNGLRISNRE